MCTQPNGHMGKSKALETALSNKLLGSHEHLKKGLFSPSISVLFLSALFFIYSFILYWKIVSLSHQLLSVYHPVFASRDKLVWL